MWRHALLAAAIGMATSALAQPQKAPTPQELVARGARQLTGAEIAASRVGNTWYYMRLSDGGVLAVHYRDARNRVAIFQGQKRHTTWRLDGDKACDEAVAVSGIYCGIVYRLGNELHLCGEREATCALVVRQIPGNPEGL